MSNCHLSLRTLHRRFQRNITDQVGLGRNASVHNRASIRRARSSRRDDVEVDDVSDFNDVEVDDASDVDEAGEHLGKKLSVTALFICAVFSPGKAILTVNVKDIIMKFLMLQTILIIQIEV